METRTFDPTSLAVARQRIDTLFDAFVAATGIPITTSSDILAGDKAFVSRYRRSNFSHGTYDMFAGRASALWPEAKPWPEGVPRPAPEPVPTKLKTLYDARMGKAAAPETEQETANG